MPPSSRIGCVSLALIAICLLLSPGDLRARVNADFSGRWTRVAFTGALDKAFVSLGLQLTIKQSESALVIEGTWPDNRANQRTYRLDGSASENPTTTAQGEPVAVTSTTEWMSNALLVRTTTVGPAFRYQWFDIYSINGDGNLVIASVGPNLFPSGTTSTITRTYKRIGSK